MRVTFRDRLHNFGWLIVFRFWNLRWQLPTLRRRETISRLKWQRDLALEGMQRVLDDLETRGDETTARGRLYVLLTQVDWT